MNRHIIVFGASVLLGSALVYGGCGNDDDANLAPKADAGAPEVFFIPEAAPPPNPPPPALLQQVDRAGRPFINTAVNDAFEPDASTRKAAEDEYNGNADAAAWSGYATQIAKNLAIYDGLDTTCGNQAFADGDAGDSNAQRYGALAGLLADDRLWLDTTKSTCAQYLALEVAALTKTTSSDCGGRVLVTDVIDQTYQYAAGGLDAGGDGGLTDGVDRSTSKTGDSTFPYLVAPQ